MAGFNQTRAVTSTTNTTRTTGATGTSKGTVNENELFSTGMFKPDKEGVKSIASVKLKEDLNIPAGSYVNVYINEYKKEANHPDFKLRITKGK